ARDGAHRGRDVPGPAPRRGRRLDGLDAQDPPGTAARHPPVRFRGREVPQTAPEGRLPRRRVEPPSARYGGPRGHPRGVPGARPRGDEGGADAGGRWPVRPDPGAGRGGGGEREPGRGHAGGIQYGPLLFHEGRRGPSPLPSGLRMDRSARIVSASRRKPSSTPTPVFALVYNQGHPRFSKNASISPAANSGSGSRSFLFTKPNVGMSPATDRIERAHASRAASVSFRVWSATAKIPSAPW